MWYHLKRVLHSLPQVSLPQPLADLFECFTIFKVNVMNNSKILSKQMAHLPNGNYQKWRIKNNKKCSSNSYGVRKSVCLHMNEKKRQKDGKWENQIKMRSGSITIQQILGIMNLNPTIQTGSSGEGGSFQPCYPQLQVCCHDPDKEKFTPTAHYPLSFANQFAKHVLRVYKRYPLTSSSKHSRVMGILPEN